MDTPTVFASVAEFREAVDDELETNKEQLLPQDEPVTCDLGDQVKYRGLCWEDGQAVMRELYAKKKDPEPSWLIAAIKTIGKLSDTKVAGLPGDISKPLEPIFGNVKFGELWKGLQMASSIAAVGSLASSFQPVSDMWTTFTDNPKTSLALLAGGGLAYCLKKVMASAAGTTDVNSSPKLASTTRTLGPAHDGWGRDTDPPNSSQYMPYTSQAPSRPSNLSDPKSTSGESHRARPPAKTGSTVPVREPDTETDEEVWKSLNDRQKAWIARRSFSAPSTSHFSKGFPLF